MQPSLSLTDSLFTYCSEMSTMSSSLRDESLKYRKAARQINIDAMLRKWAPVGAVGFLFCFIIWLKFF